MSEFSKAVEVARAALSGPRHALADTSAIVPDAAGLYAIYGSPAAWARLGLGRPRDDRPLYVGKAESSLVTRDLKTHFGSGRTGSSTVRRSFGGLLRDTLSLQARPRNPVRPERFANYGLADDDDERLTDWMRGALRFAVWPKPAGVLLIDVECAADALAATAEPQGRQYALECSADRGAEGDGRRRPPVDARTWLRDLKPSSPDATTTRTRLKRALVDALVAQPQPVLLPQLGHV